MFYKNSSNRSLGEILVLNLPNPDSSPDSTGLHLVSKPDTSRVRASKPALPVSRYQDLLVIASRRCSAFFAEASVLVLVFGILDYFMLKGRIELPWIIGALALSVSLLAASVATDFTAQCWIKAHP